MSENTNHGPLGTCEDCGAELDCVCPVCLEAVMNKYTARNKQLGDESFLWVKEKLKLTARITELEAEIARLTDPAMKCKECPFNLKADLATAVALVEELLKGTIEAYKIQPEPHVGTIGTRCPFCGAGVIGGTRESPLCYDLHCPAVRARAFVAAHKEASDGPESTE